MKQKRSPPRKKAEKRKVWEEPVDLRWQTEPTVTDDERRAADIEMWTEETACAIIATADDAEKDNKTPVDTDDEPEGREDLAVEAEPKGDDDMLLPIPEMHPNIFVDSVSDAQYRPWNTVSVLFMRRARSSLEMAIKSKLVIPDELRDLIIDFEQAIKEPPPKSVPKP